MMPEVSLGMPMWFESHLILGTFALLSLTLYAKSR